MKNGRLAICVPSRSRPLAFARFLDSYLATAHGYADVLLRNGEADPLKDEYAVFEDCPGLIRVVGTDEGFNSVSGNAGYNCAQQDLWERYPDYSAYWSIEDDCVINTPGFDTQLLSMFDDFPKRVGLLLPHDWSNTIKCPVMSAEWCDALGWMFDPQVGEHGFNQVLHLAQMYPAQFAKAVSVQFTHQPLLRNYGYTGNERPGSMEQPEVVNKFYEQTALYDEWMQNRARADKAKLREAAE